MNRYLLSTLLILSPSISFAHGSGRHYKLYDEPWIVSAADKRINMLEQVYRKHRDVIDWWVETINIKILRASSACELIEVTAASYEVQDYLVEVYERAGYRVNLEPGWTVDHPTPENPGKPNGKTYLNLSW